MGDSRNAKQLRCPPRTKNDKKKWPEGMLSKGVFVRASPGSAHALLRSYAVRGVAGRRVFISAETDYVHLASFFLNAALLQDLRPREWHNFCATFGTEKGLPKLVLRTGKTSHEPPRALELQIYLLYPTFAVVS